MTVQKIRMNSTRRVQMGARIKIAATQAEVSLKELAEATHTSRAMIYQYVRGNVSVPVDTLKRIAEVTGSPLSFFEGTETVSVTSLKEEKQEANQVRPVTPTSEPHTHLAAPQVSLLATTERIRTELRHLHALYTAYDQPKRDRSACIATLNQMIVLARTMQNTNQEAWALWQLGRNCFEADELDEAKRHLSAAIDLFATQALEEYRASALLDLALVLRRQGHLDAARRHLDPLVDSPLLSMRWRALISLGTLRFQQRDYEGAIHFLIRAARQGEQLTSEEEKQALMQHLMEAVTDVLRTTGHYDAALSLWLQQLERAARQRQGSQFLEALLEIAQCCQSMGRLSEARQRLELAVVLAGFLFEDESRSGIARALLARTLVSLGRVEEARDQARLASRIANKAGGARASLLASLAQAETSLASGQWEEALHYAQEALDEARRTARGQEVASAHEVRARAYLKMGELRRDQGEEAEAWDPLNRALSEAQLACDQAERANQFYEQVAATITLARCYLVRGEETTAQETAAKAVALIESGGSGLPRLLGMAAHDLPVALRSGELNLPELFADRHLALPTLEWQAHYLEASLLSKRLEPKAAFTALCRATEAAATILNGFNQKEAASFWKQTPEMVSLFDLLAQSGVTETKQAMIGSIHTPLAVSEALQRPLHDMRT